jgi:hypothetical protein
VPELVTGEVPEVIESGDGTVKPTDVTEPEVGVTQAPAPLRKVVELAVPLPRLATGIWPVPQVAVNVPVVVTGVVDDVTDKGDGNDNPTEVTAVDHVLLPPKNLVASAVPEPRLAVGMVAAGSHESANVPESVIVAGVTLMPVSPVTPMPTEVTVPTEAKTPKPFRKVVADKVPVPKLAGGTCPVDQVKVILPEVVMSDEAVNTLPEGGVIPTDVTVPAVPQVLLPKSTLDDDAPVPKLAAGTKPVPHENASVPEVVIGPPVIDRAVQAVVSTSTEVTAFAQLPRPLRNLPAPAVPLPRLATGIWPDPQDAVRAGVVPAVATLNVSGVTPVAVKLVTAVRHEPSPRRYLVLSAV